MVNAYDYERNRKTEILNQHSNRRQTRSSKMNKLKIIFACLIVIVILGGFAYAYINKLNAFNQTKSYLESLGFDISNNVSGIDISTVIKMSNILPMVNVASFISIARQYNATTIYEEGFSFYVVTASILAIVYEYTPNNSIWWIWGWNMA